MSHSALACTPASRRALVTALFCAAGLAAFAGPAAAQAYPAKPIRIVVPTGVGTVSDMVGRLLATHMAKSLGQASKEFKKGVDEGLKDDEGTKPPTA